MSLPGRRALLCSQDALTGIDFVQVTDPKDQRVLRVFFIVEPDRLTPPLVEDADTEALPLADASDERQVFAAPDAIAISDQHPTAVTAVIEAVHGDEVLEIEQQQWLRVSLGGVERYCLALEMAEPGGFEPYRLTLSHDFGAGGSDQIDPFLGSIVFDFKQACETGYDCEREQDCESDAGLDFPVDYLARDFHSFRRALLDFAAQRYPDWREPIEADMATMLMEIMAHLGDEFAYIQDRHDAESRFASATQRASLEAHAALVDYVPQRGRPAHGEIVLTAAAGASGEIPADTTYWAAGESGDGKLSVPFTQDHDVWVAEAWNALPIHAIDPEADCFARGMTELLVTRPDPWDASLMPLPPADPTQLDAKIREFLEGRRAILTSDPTDPSFPRRSWPVTITEAEMVEDPLRETATGVPAQLLRIGWSANEATPFDLSLDGLALELNIASVTAGRKITEFIRVGEDADVAAAFGALEPIVIGKLLDLPRMIEREGPLAAAADERPAIFRHGLAASEATSLRFDAEGNPNLNIRELEPDGVPSPPPVTAYEMLDQHFTEAADDPSWTYYADLLKTALDTPAFTVEPGMWRTVRDHQLPLASFAFGDYAGDAGWTVKFGYGETGRAPADGTILRIDYHTDPGVAANIPSFAIGLEPLGESAAPVGPVLLAEAVNWAPFTNAAEAESAASVKMRAPQKWRAEPRRAVRPEDYSAIIGRKDWVQRANSVSRWTGSWQTDFVSADPVGSVTYSGAMRRELAEEIDCIRLASRDARPAEPDYIDIDIEVIVCIARGFYEGDVLEDLREALEPPGLFSPDNFTFGQPLYRSRLEAAAQAVPGVAHVEDIRVRVLGRDTEWRSFSETALFAGPGQIIRLQNDYDRATLGLLRITSVGEL